MFPGCDSSFKICQRMRSPLIVAASKSTSFETVVTVDIGSYRRYTSSPSDSAMHQLLCSSSRQRDQHMIQLCVHVAKQSRIKPVVSQVNDGFRIVTVSFDVFVDFCQRTTKNAQTNCEAILATCRPHLRTVVLVLRRKRTDPLLLL